MLTSGFRATTHFSLGPYTRQNLTLEQQRQVLTFYESHRPNISFISRTHTGQAPPGSVYISNAARVHNYVIYQGRRITPSAFNGNAGNSLIQYMFNGRRYVGEVANIFTHIQTYSDDSVLMQYFIAVRWLSADDTFDTSIWDPLSVLYSAQS